MEISDSQDICYVTPIPKGVATHGLKADALETQPTYVNPSHIEFLRSCLGDKGLGSHPL